MNDNLIIVVQAGGRGSRLEGLTTNKPKCLVSVDNSPIIFHLFKSYPNAHFKVIGDYKFDVLKKYIETFSKEYHVELFKASKKGTCSGICDVLETLEDEQSFVLLWCDLILAPNFKLPQIDGQNSLIGLSNSFECRWSYQNKKMIEEKSSSHGIAGFFAFPSKKIINDVPQEGEFVRYLSTKNISFKPFFLDSSKEIGTMISYLDSASQLKCRPFNKLIVESEKIIKIPTDTQGEEIAKNEANWYKKVIELNFSGIPKVFCTDPITLERVNGRNIYEYKNFNYEQKKIVILRICESLNNLHKLLPSIPSSYEDCMENYVYKTITRLEKVKALIPFAQDELIRINGKYYENPFFMFDKLKKAIAGCLPNDFCVIHGDCTFSNIMLSNDTLMPILIDPRGYFGQTKIYGDIDYDWAKLYYSLRGDYDQFNMKNFMLDIRDDDIIMKISSNNWEDIESIFFREINTNKFKIKLLHAIIWLSLTTYACDDYDSICGAFYNGTIYLNEVL